MIERTENYKGYTIEIYYDKYPSNPRTEWDNAGVMVCFHNGYNLGDKHDYRHDNYDSWQEVREAIESDNDVAVILPLYLYDHSGITISTSPFSCRWDSGQVGWIYMTKKTMEAEGWTEEQATRYLEGEVETYDNYLTGEVYGFTLSDKEGDVIDSCSGYYGNETIEELINECKATVDRELNIIGEQLELEL